MLWMILIQKLENCRKYNPNGIKCRWKGKF